jgi:hypothetical protein
MEIWYCHLANSVYFKVAVMIATFRHWHMTLVKTNAANQAGKTRDHKPG